MERRSWSTPNTQREAPTSPSVRSRRHRVLGISGGGEHAPRRHRSTDAARGSFAPGLPAHAAHLGNVMSSPLFPASQTIGLAPGTERYGTSPARDGAEKNGRRHGSSALRRCKGVEQGKRGQGRQPRTEEDRRLAGVPACRNRVAEIGSRNRGSEKRIVGPLQKKLGRTSFGAWAGARPRGGHLGRCRVARRETA